jgi:hypothetical protein
MSHKDDAGRKGAIHHGDADNKSGANDPKSTIHKGPGKQNPDPDDQARHGGGEGTTGLMPGAGHPRGR